MIDELESKEIAFNHLSQIENVRVLTAVEKKISGYSPKVDVWEIDTEISINNKPLYLLLHISFEKQFPQDFPKIYLSIDTYEKTKYIPHVDNDRFVCTFDSEIASTNVNEPAGIVLECIKRAKKIIHDGLIGVNNNDFEDEFAAYWEGKYDNEKFLPENILSLINRLENDSEIKLICLKIPIQNYKYILHASDNLSIRFKEYLTQYKKEYYEVIAFYLKDYDKNEPPFSIKNKDVIKIVKEYGDEELKNFKSYINKNEYPKLVICKKQYSSTEYFFGWFHVNINTNVKGFRPGKFKPFDAISSLQSNDMVARISTDKFTPERLNNRTSGIEKLEHNRCFVIAGVGSIGSNLIYFLNSMNFPEFRFIDNEILKLENIARHLLGFDYIGEYKASGLKNFILKKNPLQKVSAKHNSITEIIKNDINYVNEADFIFMTIGKTNVDSWVCQSLVEGVIKKPIFLIWVEPFICGGHCLYLHPSNPDFEKYFEDGFFKFNIINSDEYKTGNNQLSLREAGCQTTYTPYSGANVIRFLSSLFPVLASIIDQNITQTKSYSWIGNIDLIQEKKIKISDYYRERTKGTLVEHCL